MMCVSFHNLRNKQPLGTSTAAGFTLSLVLKQTVAWTLLCALPLAVMAPSQSMAEAYSSTHTGPKHSYGPDHESKGTKGIAGSTGMVDAYGNPVQPYEEERKPSRREQLGFSDDAQKKPQGRPLPDLPEKDAGWQF